jgi:hypothetical protein
MHRQDLSRQWWEEFREAAEKYILHWETRRIFSDQYVIFGGGEKYRRYSHMIDSG